MICAMREYRLLGRLEVADDGHPLPLGGLRCRAVLAVLSVAANRFVSVGRVIDEVWGERPPATAANVIQGHISDLRRTLGRDAIETRDDAYRLVAPSGSRDLDQFERLTADGSEALRNGGADEAATAYRAALALWRGRALDDIAGEGMLVAESVRLEEMRTTALERRIEADLECGRHAELIGELQSLVAEHPHREPFRADLALALYRSGRSVEALEVLREARRALDEQLGLEPGPALQQLERSILQHDPALQPPSAPPTPVSAATPMRSIMVAALAEQEIAPVADLGAQIASVSSRELIMAMLVEDAARLTEGAANLSRLRADLVSRGVTARSAVFTSTDVGTDISRLAATQDVDLAVIDATACGLADHRVISILADAPCDVGVLIGVPGEGPVMVPFSGAADDWSAVELAAWLASITGRPLMLAGASGSSDGRDASRLLASASLAVQRSVGVDAQPLLVDPDPAALVAAAEPMGLVVIGLPERRTQRADLGPTRTALVEREHHATLVMRRGLRPGGLAPPGAETRFTWTIKS